MASTYTTDLAIQLMATGENAGTWGAITNTNLVVIQQAIAGYQGISIAGTAQTTALVMTQNALSNARNAVIKLTGTITGNQIVTVPNGIEKTWIVSNGTVGASTVTFKYASTGTGQTWSATDKGIKILYADGSDIQVVDLSTLSGSIVAAQITNSTITQAKLASNSIGTAQLQTGAVTAVKITQSTITQNKLATGSVGSDQLVATAVTPGSYVVASITVDADGRITAASSGTAGGTAKLAFTNIQATGSPGSFTTPADAIGLNAFVEGAPGGGAGGTNAYQASGGNGGIGGYGFLTLPATTNYSWTVGSGGNGGNPGYNGGNQGNAGNATTFSNPSGVIATSNGGGGAGSNPWRNGGVPGNSGTSTGPAVQTDLTNNGAFYNFYGVPHTPVGSGVPTGTGGTGGPGRVTIFQYIK